MPKKSEHNPQSRPAAATGLRRIILAAKYSSAGLSSAWRTQAAFRQNVYVVVPGVLLAMWLPLGLGIKLFMIAIQLMVLIVELLNSAIESTVDRISSEWHSLSKQAKDMGSAAVMLAWCIVVVSWLVILVKMLFHS